MSTHVPFYSDEVEAAKAKYLKTVRGLDENRRAREQIDAELEEVRAQSAKQHADDLERQRQAEIDDIATHLRLSGATDEEAQDMAAKLRMERIAAGARRGPDVPLDYVPLM